PSGGTTVGAGARRVPAGRDDAMAHDRTSHENVHDGHDHAPPGGSVGDEHAGHEHAGHAGHGDHSDHADHAGHTDHADHTDHAGHVDQFRRLFWIMLVLAVPVVGFSRMFAM